MGEFVAKKYDNTSHMVWWNGHGMICRTDSLGNAARIADALNAQAAPPAAPRVERYGDGVLVHWPEGMEQYVCVGDCVTGNLGAMAVPASDPPVMELIGKYWDLGFTEGKTGVNQADAANELLHQIRRALAQQPAAAVPKGCGHESCDCRSYCKRAAAERKGES